MPGNIDGRCNVKIKDYIGSGRSIVIKFTNGPGLDCKITVASIGNFYSKFFISKPLPRSKFFEYGQKG